MGSNLPVAPADGSPRFIIRALKDPFSVDLERVQMVKGWIDEAGETHEQVYDIDVREKGAAEFFCFWQDPDFDSRHSAFYYLRVLEVAKPRWTTIDAERLKTEKNTVMPETIQDRVYTSPIWYSKK